MTAPSPSVSPAPRATVGALVSLAWPIVISRSSQTIVGLSDALLVTHLGEAALAATTTGALNTLNLLILPMGIVFIVASFASQLHGAGDEAGARRYGYYGLAVAAATQLLALAVIPFIPRGLALFGYAPEVRTLMGRFLQIRLLGAGAAIGMEALGNYYGGLGNTRLPMAANLALMVLNVAGNLILIDGIPGVPAMGVAGSALASALATGAAFLGLLACFLLGVGVPGRRVRSRLRVSELARMLRFGLPSGLNWFLEFLAFSFFINVVVTGLGTTALAAMMTVLQLNAVSFMPGFAVASAGAILVGQAIGAGRPDDVPRTLRLTLVVVATWQAVVALSYLVVPRLLLGPFRPPAGGALFFVVGSRLLVLAAAWQLFDATVTVVAETLRAAGDTAFTLWARVAIAWFLFVPGTLLTVRTFGGGDVAATSWIVGYLALLAVVLILRFRSGAWRRIDLTGAGAGASQG